MIHRKLYYKRVNAFTLVEILVAMSISLIVLSSIYLLFSSSTRTYNKTNLHSEILADTRICMDRMVRELRQAKSIVIINPSKLIFEMYDSDDPGLFGVVGTKRVTYQLQTKDSGPDIFVRQEHGVEDKILYEDKVKIESNIFKAYVEDNKTFREFRWQENFSEDRKKITLINIRLNVKAFADENVRANVRTDAAIRHIHNRLSQPYWKYSVD
jgi:prepilin-type N-terminal cleavage/methylation domain-containing protein